jgi:eukaryotic-like serine/threonine-protein kinase
MAAKEQTGADVTRAGVNAPADANSTVRLGGAPPRAHAPLPTQRFTDYGEIARGGMSSVRRVFDNLVLREVAMKTLEPTRNFDALAHFIEEAQITGQLDHPNIVPVHDIEMDEQGLPTRFTMKLVRGHTLEERLKECGPPPLAAEQLEELLQVFLRVCDAVAFAHSRGVIHRDLKPANIMVGTHGQVYVMDWGVAMLREAPRASDGAKLPGVQRSGDTLPEAFGSMTGTPLYMAPEQARGEVSRIDERTDVYGLGGILYQMLTRRAPHEAPTIEETLQLAKRGSVPAPADVLPHAMLPPFLCRIAAKALAPAPQHRYPSVEELKRDVEAFLRGGGWFAQQRFPAGTPIVVEGDAAEAAYIITQGQCGLHKHIDGAQRFVRTLEPGDVFGETAIFSSSTRTATVIAQTDVTALVVTRAALERELDRSDWLRAFVRAVAERFVELDRKINGRSSDP